MRLGGMGWAGMMLGLLWLWQPRVALAGGGLLLLGAGVWTIRYLCRHGRW